MPGDSTNRYDASEEHPFGAGEEPKHYPSRPASRAQWPGVDGPVLGPVSVEPGRVELRLVPDAGVHLQHLPDGHGGVRGGRQGEVHPQGPVFTLWREGRRENRKRV